MRSLLDEDDGSTLKFGQPASAPWRQTALLVRPAPLSLCPGRPVWSMGLFSSQRTSPWDTNSATLALIRYVVATREASNCNDATDLAHDGAPGVRWKQC